MIVLQTVNRDVPVPPLSMAEIAAAADDVLRRYADHFEMEVEPPIEIEDLVGSVIGLRIEFENLVERLGESVIGGMFMRDRRMAIDESLDPRVYPENIGRYHFTLAHELGHWELHREYALSSAAQKILFGDQREPDILCRGHGPRPPVERQADQFAGCLLMPEWLLRPAWHAMTGSESPKCDAELSRAIGNVDLSRFADQLGGNQALLEVRTRREMFCLPLADQFEVSDEAMRIQLEDLGLFVAEHQPRLF